MLAIFSLKSFRICLFLFYSYMIFYILILFFFICIFFFSVFFTLSYIMVDLSHGQSPVPLGDAHCFIYVDLREFVIYSLYLILLIFIWCLTACFHYDTSWFFVINKKDKWYASILSRRKKASLLSLPAAFAEETGASCSSRKSDRGSWPSASIYIILHLHS